MDNVSLPLVAMICAVCYVDLMLLRLTSRRRSLTLLSGSTLLHLYVEPEQSVSLLHECIRYT